MILKQRLKVPPLIHQFSKTLDNNLVSYPIKMLLKYRPEGIDQKKERLLKRAQAETEGKTPEFKKPIVVKYGLNHVTYLIEQNKAKLVVIAHDIDPIELVVWLPALYRKMEILYCIVEPNFCFPFQIKIRSTNTRLRLKRSLSSPARECGHL
ncbi:60S ribosomal protein l7a [Phtheirospermum japonicum]|uniref:60S ribosomal protein L7a n=1 Tax=Phtheirospermum japonicum TaxID=374723 RepID=A0A830BNP4_9LAMI|nr:60S ribosomal protein l7a [Phtheirospermum japonicum]